MKNAIIFTSCMIGINCVSCWNSGADAERLAMQRMDSMAMADSLAALPFLENILDLHSEEDLIRKYMIVAVRNRCRDVKSIR